MPMGKNLKSKVAVLIVLILTFATLIPVFADSGKDFYDRGNQKELSLSEARAGIKDGGVKFEDLYQIKEGKYKNVKEMADAEETAILSYMEETGKSLDEILEAFDEGDEDVITAIVEKVDAEKENVEELDEPPAVDVNKEDLETAINEAKELEKEDYTEESWAALGAALEAAEAVFENEEATQEEVDAALADLVAAVDGLEEIVELIVESVSAINDVNVAFGTPVEELELPATVEVTLSNEEKDVANVTWNTENYDPQLEGEQVLEGTLSVPEGKEWTIPEELLAVTVKVIVSEDPQAAIVAAAEEAVKAYEDAPITNAEEIAAAEALEKVAVEKVELVADAEVKAGFETRIATKKAAVDAKKAELEEAELEKARQAEAEKAVKEYEEAPYTTLEEIELAEGLEEAARAAVELVKDEEVKTALAGRIDAQKALIDAAKAYQQLKAAVEEKVAAYEAATEDLSTQELVDAAKAAKAEIALEGLNEEDTAAFEERIAEADAKVDAAQKELNKLEVKEVKAVNATTVEVTFVEALAEDFDLTGKTITLTAGEATLTATYEADSYLNGVANFVLAKDEALVDAVEYTVSADWAKFATDKFVAKIVAPYIKTVEVTTESVPAVTYKAAVGETPASGITTIYFTAKDQYGNDIALTNTNVANLKAYATLNGMPLKNDELDSKVDTTGTITIKKTLAEGSNLVVTFKNKIGEDTIVVGTKEFTVAKAATAVPTTLGKIKAVYTDGENQGKEVKSLAANDKVTLSVPVVDQFGNPMTGQNVRWFVEKGEEHIDVVTPSTMPGDAVEMEFTAKSAGDIVISAFLENGQKATYTATIGAAKLQTLTYSEELKAGFNNEEIVLGKIAANEGATLTPEMIKFEVKATEPATADDVVVSARLRGGDDKDTAKDIVIVAKSSKVGTYKITPYVGTSFTDENVIKASEITLETTLNPTVASFEIEPFKENELTKGGKVQKVVTFKNKHGEEILPETNILNIIESDKEGVVAIAKHETIDKVKTFVIEFEGRKAGDYVVTLVTGAISKQIPVTVVEAAKLKTVELGANITSGVIAGKLNGTEVKPFVRIVEIKDQYGNDFIPANLTGLTIEVSDRDTLTEPTATFKYYKLNTKKEIELQDNKDNDTKGVVLVIDANGSNNTVDKIATITVKTKDTTPVVLDTVNVTVKALRKVDSVTLTPVSTNLALGGTTTLKVEVKDQYGDLFQVDTTEIAKSDNDVVELGNVTQAKDDKNADIKGAYTISVKGLKAGTQEVKIDVKDTEGKVLASDKVTFTVKAAGEVIDSIVIDETDLASLYSTKAAAVVDLTAIAKDANGNVVAVPNADLMWSAVGYNAKGEVVADAVTSIVDGKLTVKQTFVGTVEVKVMTANLKEDTVVLNFDNADPEAVLSTLKVATTVEDKTVLVKSPVEIEKGKTLKVFLAGLDQYEKPYTVDKDVTPFSENTAVATVTGTGDVTITPVSVGTAKINLIYSGTAYSITVEVVEPTPEEAKAAFMETLEAQVQGIEVAEVAIDGDSITATFNAPEEGKEGEFIREVQTVAEGIFSSLKEEVDEGTITFTIDNKEGETINLKTATATDIAEALLGGRLEKALEFLKGEAPITADYVANLTKDGVNFKLEGNLKFEVKAE